MTPEDYTKSVFEHNLQSTIFLNEVSFVPVRELHKDEKISGLFTVQDDAHSLSLLDLCQMKLEVMCYINTTSRLPCSISRCEVNYGCNSFTSW
jgi:hypothetical protein